MLTRSQKASLTPFIKERHIRHASFRTCFCASVCWPVAATAETLSSERQAELRNLLLQDCGSCHGMRLTGGLGPALTPQALQGKSREQLIATVSEGRPGTPMPPMETAVEPD